MAPRRHRSSSNVQRPASSQNAPPPTQRTQTPGTTTQRQLGMLPTVYQNNMKVLMRREPSIIAIIDQFSHVCLYNHNGQKWEKHGYEGSMFLYEKSTYPTYGFYILNRMGTDDFVRPIYPEDDMEIMGDYLMYRFYPDFTKTRLEMGLPYPVPPEHRAAFDHELYRRIPPEERGKDREKKGRSIILGLWMFATDAREPLKEVMMRYVFFTWRVAAFVVDYLGWKYWPCNALRRPALCAQARQVAAAIFWLVYCRSCDRTDNRGQYAYSTCHKELARRTACSAFFSCPQLQLPILRLYRLSCLYLSCRQCFRILTFCLPSTNALMATHRSRLHSYVKRGLPYPDEFKYGPGRPPPPNPHLRTASRSSVYTPSQDQGTSQANSTYYNQALPSVEQASAATSGAGSELDKLFAKLIPPSASAPLPTGLSAISSAGATTTNISVHDLFAAARGSTESGTSSVPPAQSYSAVEATSAIPSELTSSSGIALLDSIFASVTPAGSSAALHDVSQGPLPPRSEEITIVSPKPTSSALPQILNQDVIHTLLGLGPDSRASSAAPSSVGSRRSNHNRYEGDNEYSEGDGVSDGAPSRSATVAVNGRATGVPTFSVHQAASSESEAESGERPNSSRRVQGDVTPRPPAGGLRLPPGSPPQFQPTSTPSASLSAPTLSSQTNGASGISTSASAPRERPLVPFEANSELWPYPRAPLDDRSFENDDVVELDFADTRALSDPTIFSSRLKEKQQKKKSRKSKKEREEESQRERAAIEKGWDMPAQIQGRQQPHPPPATQSSLASGASGDTVMPNNPPKQTKKPTVNGSGDVGSHVNGHSRNVSMDNVAAKDAILAVLHEKPGASGRALSQKDFITEILTLIHSLARLSSSRNVNYVRRFTAPEPASIPFLEVFSNSAKF
ncbi:hypothetical protein C8Q78DRAFT_1143324 [Trametes maxima]|nr:hypothetical protein C8Q78DRAFT_1143324 [Trametes maxima]